MTGRRDIEAFRATLGRFPTGVAVVASRDPAGRTIGMTVNSFTSVSLDPLLILVCIDRDATSHASILASGSFSVNVLAGDQEGVARRFATAPADTRFEGVAWREGPEGLPLLEGVVAWLACSVHAVHAAGDHSIVVGHTDAWDACGGSPLVFHRGAYVALQEPA